MICVLVISFIASRQVCPPFSGDNVLNGPYRDTEMKRQELGALPVYPSPANLQNIDRFQLRPAVSLTSRNGFRMGVRSMGAASRGAPWVLFQAVAASSEAILNVLGLTAGIEMAGPDAGWIVTMVQDLQPSGDRPVLKLPGEAMSVQVDSFEGEPPISGALASAGPDPARPQLGPMHRWSTTQVYLRQETTCIGAEGCALPGMLSLQVCSSAVLTLTHRGAF